MGGICKRFSTLIWSGNLERAIELEASRQDEIALYYYYKIRNLIYVYYTSIVNICIESS